MTALVSAVLASQAALYGPPAADRIAQLIDAADALTWALQTLRTHPTPDGAERVAGQLHVMHRSACHIVARLAHEAMQ